MPIKPELRWFYPIDWPEISRRVRFERAGGLCEGCGRPHGEGICCLPDGRWFDPMQNTWRNGRGRRDGRMSRTQRRFGGPMSFWPPRTWTIIPATTPFAISGRCASAAIYYMIARITWSAGGSPTFYGGPSGTCSLVRTTPILRSRTGDRRGQLRRVAVTACAGWSWLDTALKPAATRPPSGLWGLTAPPSKYLSLECRK